MKKLRVYVGCGLTHAPKTFRNKIALFKEELRKIPWIVVLDFVSPASGSLPPDPLGIYTHDIHGCVYTANAIIADLSYASTGLGWELGTSAEKLRIRTIMCSKKNKIVSNLPLGAPRHQENGHLSFKIYEKSILDLLPYFVEELELLHAELK
jgi:hypothetical protein